jgi:hypothetical protein
MELTKKIDSIEKRGNAERLEPTKTLFFSLKENNRKVIFENLVLILI